MSALVLAAKPVLVARLPAAPVPRAWTQAGLAATVLGAAAACGCRRDELGVRGPGLLVLVAGAPFARGRLRRRVLLEVPVGTVLGEEMLLRGVLWAVLHRELAPRAAAVWHAAVFGLWHVPDARRAGQPVLGVVALTAAVGLGLGALRARTDGVLVPALVHWAVNAAGVVLADGSALRPDPRGRARRGQRRGRRCGPRWRG